LKYFLLETTFPPVFSKRLQSITVEEGKRIYLEIDVFAKPTPEIQWELNGTTISASNDRDITLRSDTPTRHSLIVADGRCAFFPLVSLFVHYMQTFFSNEAVFIFCL